MQLGKTLQQKSNIEFLLLLSSKENLRLWTKANHSGSSALIFIGTVEDTVRAIAPFVSSESFKSAVIVVDELSKFAVPIISGSVLNANALALQFADILKSVPVITAEEETEDTFSVDTWAKSIGLRIANPQAAKYVSSKLKSGEVVYFDSVFEVSGSAPKGIVPAGDFDNSDFSITYLSSVPEKVLHLVPPVLTLGISCKNEADCESIERAYSEFLVKCGCHPLAVYQVCSIDNAAHITGLTDFCGKHALPLRVFSSDELSHAVGRFSVPDYNDNASDIDNVCERSAVLGSKGNLFVRKMTFGGISMALSIAEPDISEN